MKGHFKENWFGYLLLLALLSAIGWAMWEVHQSAQQVNKDTAAKVQAQERTDGYVSSTSPTQ